MWKSDLRYYNHDNNQNLFFFFSRRTSGRLGFRVADDDLWLRMVAPSVVCEKSISQLWWQLVHHADKAKEEEQRGETPEKEVSTFGLRMSLVFLSVFWWPGTLFPVVRRYVSLTKLGPTSENTAKQSRVKEAWDVTSLKKKSMPHFCSCGDCPKTLEPNILLFPPIVRRMHAGSDEWSVYDTVANHTVCSW